MAALAIRVESALVDRNVRGGREGHGVVGTAVPGIVAVQGSVAGESAAGLRRDVVVRGIAQGRNGAAGGPFHLRCAQEFEVVLCAGGGVGHDVALGALGVDLCAQVLGVHPGIQAVVFGRARSRAQGMALAATGIHVHINGSGLPTGRR